MKIPLILFSLLLFTASLSISSGCDGYDVGIDYPPDIELIKPTDGQVFQYGDSIVFQCSAGDPGHGALDGDQVVWNSDLEGSVIGKGQKFYRKDLKAGTHNIIITATDSMNNWSTLNFSINIQ